ncbi:MAG: AMP-binding protein [Oscillospiraceae bacterium]|nr:AMP-binding protein [Oscillospiraceae bacterium]
MLISSAEYKAKIENAVFANCSDERLLALLNEQIGYACEKSDFYRERLSTYPQLGDISDLHRLPFTTSEDLVNHGRRMICVSAGEIQRIVSLFSSGTIAEPKRIYFSRGDLQRTVDFFTEGMSLMCSPGDTAAILLPCHVPDGVGDLLSRGLKKLGAEVLELGVVTQVGEFLPILQQRRPNVMVGMPWQIRLLALAAPELRPDVVLLSADYVPQSIASVITAQWGCEVLTHFGMTETCFGCAVESLLHEGMHLRRDEIYAEIINPVSGEVLPDGETGELVLTTLRREAMPLIRYRTGDFAFLSPQHTGRIMRVDGRITIPRAFYELQERFCRFPWLYDYSATDTDGVFDITAEVSFSAPQNFRAVLISEIVNVYSLPPSSIRLRTEFAVSGNAYMYKREKRI